MSGCMRCDFKERHDEHHHPERHPERRPRDRRRAGRPPMRPFPQHRPPHHPPPASLRSGANKRRGRGRRLSGQARAPRRYNVALPMAYGRTFDRRRPRPCEAPQAQEGCGRGRRANTDARSAEHRTVPFDRAGRRTSFTRARCEAELEECEGQGAPEEWAGEVCSAGLGWR